MKSKLMTAAAALFVIALVLFFVLKPKAEPAPAPVVPHVTKLPMLRAPPRDLAAAPPATPVPPVVAAVAPDASVEAPPPAPALNDPNALVRPLPGQMNHHPPPPRSAGARFLAIERRYQNAQQAWTQLRSHKSPADQQKYDALLEQAGNELSSGARQAGAQHLQEFVSGALDGVEP